MNVRELKKQLEKISDDAEVFIGHPGWFNHDWNPGDPPSRIRANSVEVRTEFIFLDDERHDTELWIGHNEEPDPPKKEGEKT